MSVLVVLEQRGGKWNRLSFEAWRRAQKIAQASACTVAAVVLGADIEGLAQRSQRFRGGESYAVSHRAAGRVHARWLHGRAAAINDAPSPRRWYFRIRTRCAITRPSWPRVLAKHWSAMWSIFKTGTAAAILVRQLFQGKLSAEVQAVGEAAICFRSSRRFSRGGTRGRQRSDRAVCRATERGRRSAASRKSRFARAQRSVDLSAAEMIVSVGRGIKEKENLPVVEELAKRWARNWRLRGRFATMAGYRWNGR